MLLKKVASSSLLWHICQQQQQQQQQQQHLVGALCLPTHWLAWVWKPLWESLIPSVDSQVCATVCHSVARGEDLFFLPCSLLICHQESQTPLMKWTRSGIVCSSSPVCKSTLPGLFSRVCLKDMINIGPGCACMLQRPNATVLQVRWPVLKTSPRLSPWDRNVA